MTLGFGILTVVLSSVTSGPVGAQDPGPPGGLHVKVVNTPTAPALVRDVDNPARQPFQPNVGITIGDGAPAGGALLDVPSGKQLVIEYVSASVQLPTGQKVRELRVATLQGSTVLSHFLGATFQATVGGSTTVDIFILSQVTRLYSNPGTSSVEFSVIRNNSSGTGFYSLSISGYLVNVT